MKASSCKGLVGFLDECCCLEATFCVKSCDERCKVQVWNFHLDSLGREAYWRFLSSLCNGMKCLNAGVIVDGFQEAYSFVWCEGFSFDDFLETLF